MSKVRPYTNGEVVVYWESDKCIHSANCVRRLPKVFDPDSRPWIRLEKGETEAIIDTVKNCPSGALSFRRVAAPNLDEGLEKAGLEGDTMPDTEVQLLPNGPLLVKSSLRIVAEDGSLSEAQAPCALCRCGASGNKPFCDGSHRSVGFRSQRDLGTGAAAT